VSGCRQFARAHHGPPSPLNAITGRSGVLAPRINPPHAPKTLQSGLKSPDGLLEHLFKTEAVWVYKFFAKRSDLVVISIPIVRYPQGPINGNPYEIHRKDPLLRATSFSGAKTLVSR
jgi:hypothetical protein